MRSLIHVQTHLIGNICYAIRGLRVRKVSNSKSDLRMGAYDFLLVFRFNYFSILYRFRVIISYFPQIEVTWLRTHLIRGEGVIYHACAIALVNVDPQTKFETPSFTGTKDTMGPKIKKVSRDPDHTHLRVAFHFKANTWYSLYLYTKFDDSWFSRSRDMIGPQQFKWDARLGPRPFGGSLSSTGWDLLWSTYQPNLKSLTPFVTNIRKATQKVENRIDLGVVRGYSGLLEIALFDRVRTSSY